MPTYQYVCTACGEPLEAVQSFSDPALTECPACTGRLRKVFSSVGVVFKGSGFYRTDSRDAKKVGATNGSGAASKDTSASGGTSGDSAPTTSGAKESGPNPGTSSTGSAAGGSKVGASTS